MCVHISMCNPLYNCTQVKLVQKEDGTKWCDRVHEKVVHHKGWQEGSSGKGQKRLVDDNEFESMCDQLTGSGWECSLSDVEKNNGQGR